MKIILSIDISSVNIALERACRTSVNGLGGFKQDTKCTARIAQQCWCRRSVVARLHNMESDQTRSGGCRTLRRHSKETKFVLKTARFSEKIHWASNMLGFLHTICSKRLSHCVCVCMYVRAGGRWTKNSRPNLQNVNLRHSTRKKYRINTGRRPRWTSG